MESTDILDSYTASFIADSWSVIQHYHLNVSDKDNSLYLCVMKATEWTLVIKRYRGELNITREHIISILVAHYFFDIGVPDNEIARVIHYGENYCKDFAKSNT